MRAVTKCCPGKFFVWAEWQHAGRFDVGERASASGATSTPSAHTAVLMAPAAVVDHWDDWPGAEDALAVFEGELHERWLERRARSSSD